MAFGAHADHWRRHDHLGITPDGLKRADMSELLDILRREIRLQGPITLARYMDICLSHSNHGYYPKQDPLGRAGDFTTAPEISQMFGELIGLWAGVVWQQMGQPSAVNLVELGPGRGTLMADALRAASIVPSFPDAIAIHLVEISPALRAVQAEALAAHGPAWHDNDTTLPAGPLIIIANEFFDALPILQFERRASLWHERLVGLADEGQLCFVLSPPQSTNPMVPDSHKNAPNGTIVEVCPAAWNIVARLADAVGQHGGGALIIDYGHDGRRAGDTFQAVKDHRFHPPFEMPGEADLTAHVDFGALASAANTLSTIAYGPLAQGAFLEALGIRERADALMREAPAAHRDEIRSALARLTGTEEMGTLFKAMAIARSDTLPPPGFEIA